MFDLAVNERLSNWRQFRNDLENSNSPLEEVAKFWSKAPFVGSYLNYSQPETWPDPWHLVIDGKFDDLAICLGMLYTIKLTQRFIHSNCEIHMSMPQSKNDQRFFLVVDNSKVLNLDYGSSADIESLNGYKTNKIWIGKTLP